MHTNNDWFYDYFIDEVKAIRRNCVPNLQSDWSQNDDTQPDYVKNRPFYTGDPVETVLVEESTVAFERLDGPDGSAMYVADFLSTFEATVGETYKVSWDGTVYECTSVGGGSEIAIGNLSIVGAGSDTGEPFIMVVINGEGIQIGTADASSSHTISISERIAPVVKIDKKYLVQPDWNQNDETAADFVKNRTHYESSNLITKEMTFLSAASSEGLTQNDIEFANALFEHQDGLSISENGTLLNNSHIEATDDYICFYVLELETTVSTLFCELRLSNGAPTGDIRVSDSIGNQAWKNVVLTLEYEETVIHPLDEKYLPDILRPFKPAGKSYLTFSSLSSFTLAVADSTKHWNGTLEYFTSDRTWASWNGMTTLSAVADDGEYVLYLRGIGNTVITGNNSNYRWVLTGTNIKCVGNIENLLNHAMVKAGNHPMMANYCYYGMFQSCTSLTQAPALPATTLADYCYKYMFYGCKNLTQAPSLPATTLAEECYYGMFQSCTSLAQAPSLPATTLAGRCYNSMFYGCTSLAQTPSLPATTLAKNCYALMFRDCTSLTQAPALPATTLADYCYMSMFYGCKNLAQAPSLPATTLAEECYYGMFNRCSNLKLSSTRTDEYAQEYRIPSSGDGVTATNSLYNMFVSTGGTFAGTPSINTTYYLSSDNIVIRETETATLNGYIKSMINTMLNTIGVAEEGAY